MRAGAELLRSQPRLPARAGSRINAAPPSPAAVMFVVAQGITSTGGMDWLVTRVLGTPRNNSVALVRLMVATIFMSSWINNTPVRKRGQGEGSAQFLKQPGAAPPSHPIDRPASHSRYWFASHSGAGGLHHAPHRPDLGHQGQGARAGPLLAGRAGAALPLHSRRTRGCHRRGATLLTPSLPTPSCAAD